MKHFLIRYSLKNGSSEDWHREIAQFIAALENDPTLKGKISYRAMKGKGDAEYYHLTTVSDEQAVKDLGERDFFKRYTDKVELASGGGVEVLPLELVAQTKHSA
jgi:hypothetical protein